MENVRYYYQMRGERPSGIRYPDLWDAVHAGVRRIVHEVRCFCDDECENASEIIISSKEIKAWQFAIYKVVYIGAGEIDVKLIKYGRVEKWR